MLLWVLILAVFGSCVALFGNKLPNDLKARTISIQGLIGVAFLAFMILTSNPFERLSPVPLDGKGLNPILQDPALAFHPPFLYMGYVGFSIAFSFAVAALISGRVDAAWARWVRPWTLLAWMFLTIGIAMGSWWAYYELGWGGWWFWDPVENASFMPWLVGTALLHSAIVVEKREALKTWTILLAILTFSLSLMGAFLVRSGVLTSVHSFAVDPERGVFILAILAVFIGGSLALYAWRAPQLKGGGIFAPISRETALVVNNLLLCAACGSVFIGTLYPLALEAVTGGKISVGAPFFNATFVPLILPLLLLVPLGPMLSWKRADLRAATQRLFAAACLALVAGAVMLVWKGEGPVLAWFGIGLGVWLILGAASEIAYRTKLFKEPLSNTLTRAKRVTRSSWGMLLAHAGVGVMVIGITAVSAWRAENISYMKIGDTQEIAGFQVTFKNLEAQKGPNYDDLVGTFEVRKGSGSPITLTPAKRRYRVSKQITSEAGIHPFIAGDFYVVLGDLAPQQKDAYTVRIYFNPLAPLIWLGAVIMFIGGGVSLTDRRYRIGMPLRKLKPQKAG